MGCMSLRTWGYEKVDIFFDVVRPAQDQTLAFTGDIIRGPDGVLWQFVSRKDDSIQVREVALRNA